MGEILCDAGQDVKGCEHLLKISVIIPCYNPDETLLEKCVRSILMQTYRDFEIIVVNDGSDDEFTNVFFKIHDMDTRICILNKDHAGVSAARNYGVTKACGEYIVFVDADDVITPYFFSESIEIAEREHADCVIGANYHTKNVLDKIEHGNPTVYSVFEAEQKDELKTYVALKKRWKVGEMGYIGKGPVSRLVRSDVAKITSFDENLAFCEDRVWNLELLKNCSKVCVANQIWYIYYINSVSVSNKYNRQIVSQVKEYLSVITSYVDLSNDIEYFYFVLTILEDLRFIYHCYLRHKKAFRSKNESKKARLEIYTGSPWIMINEDRFFKLASVKVKIKALLFKFHLLFTFYDVKQKMGGNI